MKPNRQNKTAARNDRGGWRWLQGCVKWLAGQWVSFSSGVLPSFHFDGPLPILRRTWPDRQAAPTAARRDSYKRRVLDFGNLGDVVAGIVAAILAVSELLGLGLGKETKSDGGLIAFSFGGDPFVFSLFHVFIFLFAGLIALRWSKINPTAWVCQNKSSIIFWREIANEIKPLNS
mgnify:CR=1 FL=1|jgi:hypothetical protein